MSKANGFISDTKGQLDINLPVAAILGLILASAFLVIGVVVLQGVADSGELVSSAAADGTLTISDDATDAETVSITISGTDYVFEIDNEGNTTTGNIAVTVATLDNITVAAELKAAIAANATVAASVTPTNLDGTVTITAVETGTDANSIGTTETMANAGWSSTTLTGGVDGDELYTAMASVTTDIGSAMALAGTMLLVIIGVAILMMLAGVMVIMKAFR